MRDPSDLLLKIEGSRRTLEGSEVVCEECCSLSDFPKVS